MEADMLDTEQVGSLQGATLVGSDGDKLGSIDDIYVDEDSGRPEFALVKTGLFGTGSRFVPLQQAQIEGEEVHVNFTKDQVKDSPDFDADGDLSQDQEARIYSHYGLAYSEARSDSGLPAGTTGGTPTGRDTSGPTTDEAMTRSEEELHVGTERRETGRVRLRKHIVTENVTKTIPVQREEVRVEREPITDGNAGQAMSGPDISEEEHEVVLTEEQPVVEKRTVPKERVRLEKDTVTDQETVSEDVRKEQIETDGGAEGDIRR
jgi:uncharacterized protein (TIGR02271 family)